MNYDASRYIKALKKELRCTGSTKKRLLQQFHSSLSAYLEEHPSPTGTDLQDAFGPPNEMAGVLMEHVSEEDRRKYHHSQTIKRIFAVILVVLFFAYVTFVLFWKQKPIVVVDKLTHETTATEKLIK